jgi:hypothetical protein
MGKISKYVAPQYAVFSSFMLLFWWVNLRCSQDLDYIASSVGLTGEILILEEFGRKWSGLTEVLSRHLPRGATENHKVSQPR